MDKVCTLPCGAVNVCVSTISGCHVFTELPVNYSLDVSELQWKERKEREA